MHAPTLIYTAQALLENLLRARSGMLRFFFSACPWQAHNFTAMQASGRLRFVAHSYPGFEPETSDIEEPEIPLLQSILQNLRFL